MRFTKRKIILGVSLIVCLFLVVVLSRWLQPPSGRTNFLVLGVAGEGYVGDDLTDTMIFISLDNQTAQILILSLPRDIWVAPLRTKLNSVYHYRGLEETKEAVSQILGQPIDYGLVIDFNIFVQLIDVLGGVEIDVQRTFDDYRYPLPGKENDLCDGDEELLCRYEHIYFEKGEQLMDGATALKYIRSRFSESEEGTDFARSQRQQNLILALRSKLFSTEVFFRPTRILRLIEVINENIQIDFSQEKLVLLGKTLLKFRAGKLRTEVLDDGRLINPPLSVRHDNQWVLVPSSGDWDEIQEYIRELISN